MIMKKLFFLLIIFISPIVQSTDDVDAEKILEEFVSDHDAPAVVMPEAINEFTLKKTHWKWKKIDGIYVGYTNIKSFKDVKKKIYKNMKAFNSLSKEKTEKTFTLRAFQSESEFSFQILEEYCGIKTSHRNNIITQITFMANGYVPIDLACKIQIYGFSVNGIEFRADKEKNALIAIQH